MPILIDVCFVNESQSRRCFTSMLSRTKQLILNNFFLPRQEFGLSASRSRGFTLTELIVTVAVAAIVLTVGVPSFQQMMLNNRTAVHTNDFLGSLNQARGEAIKRGVGWRVVMCPGTAAGCSGTAWGNGWIVFVDGDADQNGILNQTTDNNGQWDNGEQLLQVHEALGSNNTLTSNMTDNSTAYISFQSDGSSRVMGSNTFQMGTFTFGLCNTENRRNTIVINSVGRASVVQQACP
jgi:type IV fimbrial biogenesis protein FimT